MDDSVHLQHVVQLSCMVGAFYFRFTHGSGIDCCSQLIFLDVSVDWAFLFCHSETTCPRQSVFREQAGLISAELFRFAVSSPKIGRAHV